MVAPSPANSAACCRSTSTTKLGWLRMSWRCPAAAAASTSARAGSAEVPGGDQRPGLLRLADDLVHLGAQVAVRAEDRDLLALHHAARLEVRPHLLVVGGVAQVRAGGDRGEPDDLAAHLQAAVHRERVQPAVLAVQRDPAEHLHAKPVEQRGHGQDVGRGVVVVALGHDRAEPRLVGLLGRLRVGDPPRHRRRAGMAVQVNRADQEVFDRAH